ncbi:MAG: phage tail assembly chaperone [Rhizobiales bacterium]|nr:phage tail assembly chaperone [Hyphomicrobiales bacterium]
MTQATFPWARLMEIGLGVMRLPPERFWQMTLPEISAAARALNPQAARGIGRGELGDLMARYPDQSQIKRKT